MSLDFLKKFKKWFNEHVPTDKVEHFLGGAWITAALGALGWPGIGAGFIITLIVSLFKERFMDDEFDMADVFAAALGGITSVVIYSVLSFLA